MCAYTAYLYRQRLTSVWVVSLFVLRVLLYRQQLTSVWVVLHTRWFWHTHKICMCAYTAYLYCAYYCTGNDWQACELSCTHGGFDTPIKSACVLIQPICTACTIVQATIDKRVSCPANIIHSPTSPPFVLWMLYVSCKTIVHDKNDSHAWQHSVLRAAYEKAADGAQLSWNCRLSSHLAYVTY